MPYSKKLGRERKEGEGKGRRKGGKEKERKEGGKEGRKTKLREIPPIPALRERSPA